LKNGGICRLTGERGKFVKAHIIPAALTKPTIAGMHFVQVGESSRPIKRWTSWYDKNLLTSKGEAIFEKYDQRGIEILRKHGLVWSGWNSQDIPKFENNNPIDEAGRGIRIFEKIEADELRMFLLSILWRAAATKLAEFKEIQLKQGQLNKLKKMLLTENPNPNYVFPICLLQFTTAAPRHNHTPLAMKKPLSWDNPNDVVRIFRFYFDGLVVHFHRDLDVKNWKKMGGLCLNSQEKFGVITMPYELSKEFEMLEHTKLEAEHNYGSLIELLTQ